MSADQEPPAGDEEGGPDTGPDEGAPSPEGGSGQGKSRVRVRIAGEEHYLRSAVDPEHTRRCAALVDERIREIQERSGLLEGHKAAILAALSIADQYLRTAEDLDRTRTGLTSRAEALVERIQAGLGESGGTSGEAASFPPEGEGEPEDYPPPAPGGE